MARFGHPYKNLPGTDFHNVGSAALAKCSSRPSDSTTPLPLHLVPPSCDSHTDLPQKELQRPSDTHSQISEEK